MFAGKKCAQCEGKLKEVYSFCPFCGVDLRDPEADMRDFGMLGKNDEVFGAPIVGGLGGMGINERMINSVFSTLMKTLEKQMRDMNPDADNFDRTEVERFPNGIKIKLGNGMGHNHPQRKSHAQKKAITEEQIQRMSKLPRGEAKADVRRFSDKVVYELKAPGVENVEDIFVSKLENGYEIKAIGKSKVYVNSIPVNLPLKKYSIKDKVLSVEFGLQ